MPWGCRSVVTGRRANCAGSNCFCNRASEGLSSLQGQHQVAQKLRSTTFPVNSLDLTTVPSSVVSSKGAAILPVGSRLILSEAKGSPASVRSAETTFSRKSIAAINTRSNEKGTLRLLPRKNFQG